MTTTSTSPRSSSSSRLRVVCSAKADGDFHRVDVPLIELEPRRRRLVDHPWTMLDEHHGTDVVHVPEPGGRDGAPGDVAITSCRDAVLGCWTADCAPVVLIGADTEFAVVHAGWRGLAAGVVDIAVAAFTEPIVGALLGPTIWPCCYEFGAIELAAVATGVHAEVASVEGRTRWAARALDVPAAVRAACAVHGIDVGVLAGCTGCQHDGFSHRVRGEAERHVLAAWRPSTEAA
jgi:copper oxidase (laccase) domain-containing protein